MPVKVTILKDNNFETKLLLENNIIKRQPNTGINVIVEGCFVLWSKNINDKSIIIIPANWKKFFIKLLVLEKFFSNK